MKFGTRRITLYAVLIAAALIISVFEDRLPAAIIPVPGVKLGLSNIITLFALYFLGAIPAVIILYAGALLPHVRKRNNRVCFSAWRATRRRGDDRFKTP